MTILDALDDPNLFAPCFDPPGTWAPWRAFLAAVYGLPVDAAELDVYQQHTARPTAPSSPAREAWVIVGRRGGKSRVAALLTVYAACFRDYSSVLGPGERGMAMVLAADRRQARVVFRYVSGLFEAVPMLRAMVQDQTRDAIHLRNRISIEIHTASFRAVRGYTIVAAVLDECAYWPTDESANPDVEIVNAIRPGMASVPGALLVGISSPYARRGALWTAHTQHYGHDGDPVLVWQADTASMNPAVDPAVIATAYEEDEARAAAEYGAQFRRDVESFVSREAVDAAIVPDRRELPPRSDVVYFGFVDPSGGSQDSMTLAVAHWENEHAVLDVTRERRPPFSPDDVVREFAALLHSYGINSVLGDRYAGEWPRERFQTHGITYVAADHTKSELYGTLLPLLNSGRVELLDDRRLVAQLAGLERRTARGGRDSIDHAPGSHDDLVNAAAGALVIAEAEGAYPYLDPTCGFAR